MTDRERLIELMKKGYETVPVGGFVYEGIADYLLANGVIVPPCKVGDTVYYIHETFFDKEYMKIVGFQSVKKIVERPLCKTNLMLERTKFDWGLMDSWLKGDIFLTREEAEKALKERETE